LAQFDTITKKFALRMNHLEADECGSEGQPTTKATGANWKQRFAITTKGMINTTLVAKNQQSSRAIHGH